MHLFHFTPDLTNWHKEGHGIYVSHDSLSRCERVASHWEVATRKRTDDSWRHDRSVYGTLHAAQDACRRAHARAAQVSI